MKKDPVCGMMVDENSKFISVHDGKVFHFCSADCKATFNEDPHKYGHQ